MPEHSAFQFPRDYVESFPHDIALAKKRLQDLVSVLMILGLLVPGVGEVAMVLGAAMAAEHLIERWRSGTLKLDESAVGDIMGVLGAVFVGASLVGKLAVGVRTSESFLLKSLEAVGKAAEMGNKALNYGGMMWGVTSALNDIMADSEAERQGKITHAEERRNRAMKIASAVQSGALVFGSLKEDLVEKPEHPAAESKNEQQGTEPRHETEATEKRTETKGDDDPVAKSGSSHEKLDPQTEKGPPTAPTFDGMHTITVREDGRIVRCSLSCGELRQHYQEFLDAALKDPQRQGEAQKLDAELKRIENLAKSDRTYDKKVAAKEAAKLEPQLRGLAAQRPRRRNRSEGAKHAEVVGALHARR